MQKTWVLMLTKHTSLDGGREPLSAKDLFIFPKMPIFCSGPLDFSLCVG